MTNLEKRLVKLERQKSRQQMAADVAATLDIRPHIAPAYYDLLDDVEAAEHTYYNLPGGRGSCKSSTVSIVIVKGVMADLTGCSNAIIFRYVAETLMDSVYMQILWAIDLLGVSHLWDCTTKPMRCTYLPTGAVILFRGLDKPKKLKSIKPRQGRFKYLWYEEFDELPGSAYARSVNQSVIRGQGKGSVVFRSFNPPISQNNWANTFIQEPDKRARTFQTNYTMVPPEWLGDDFLYEADRLKEVNPKAYEHEYMGNPVGTGGEIFPNVIIQEITDQQLNDMVHLFQGLDWGYATDPAAFIRLHYDRKNETVYLLDEIYARGMSNAKMAAEIKERGYDSWIVTADSAEPKSIADMRDSGIICNGCTKYPGCVAYRTRWLQHRKIVIDPKRTPNAYREFVEYSFPVDKNGNLLSQFPDKNNHTIDSTAYALDSVIGRRNSRA